MIARSFIGRIIAKRYKIEKEIGRGGSARVYLAKDAQSNNQSVALKILLKQYSSDPQQVEDFFRQVESQYRLDHPNVVRIFGYGTDSSHSDGPFHFIAMQYVPGGSLNDMLEQGGPLEMQRASQILVQIAAALQYAHDKGVYHRDVKPANILLSADKRRAFLTDFGIARVVGQKTISKDDKPIIGTLQFMSPEMAQNDEVDGRSDVYSLGITLYLTLTGKLPFDGPAAAILFHQVNSQHFKIRQINGEIPYGAEKIVDKAMEKKVTRRFQRADEMQAALDKFAYPQMNKRSALVYSSIALFVLLFGAIAWFFNTSLPANPAIDNNLITSTISTQAVSDNNGSEPSDSQGTELSNNDDELGEAGPTSTPLSIDDEIISTPVPDAPPTDAPTPTTQPTSTTTPTPSVTPLPPNTSSNSAPPLLSFTTIPTFSLEESQQATFSWDWEGTLRENERFQLQFQAMTDDAPQEAPFARTSGRTATVDLSRLQSTGDYEVWVVVVDKESNDSRYEIINNQIGQRFQIKIEGDS